MFILATFFTTLIYATEGDKFSLFPEETNKEALNAMPDISQYRLEYVDKTPSDFYIADARHIIENQQTDGIHAFTDQDVHFLKNDMNFINEFVEFLQRLKKVNYFSQLNKNIIDASRGAPSEEYPQGKPAIDSQIRNKNMAFVNKLEADKNEIYAKLEAHMQSIALHHEKVPY